MENKSEIEVKDLMEKLSAIAMEKPRPVEEKDYSILWKLNGPELLLVLKNEHPDISLTGLQYKALSYVKSTMDMSSLTRKLFVEGDKSEMRMVDKKQITVRRQIIVSDMISGWNPFYMKNLLESVRQEIEAEEDKLAIQLLDAVATANNKTVEWRGCMGLFAFEDLRYQVEKRRVAADKFLINRKQVSDLVRTCSGCIDPVTQRELILMGYIGDLLNTHIITASAMGGEEVVPPDVVYAVAGPELLGRFTVWEDLSNEIIKGFDYVEWVWTETISIEVNTPHVAKAVRVGEGGVFIVMVDEDKQYPKSQHLGLAVAAELRRIGIEAHHEYDLSRGVKGQMKAAGDSGLPYTLIIGPEELDGGVLKLKNMQTGAEQEVGILPDRANLARSVRDLIST